MLKPEEPILGRPGDVRSSSLLLLAHDLPCLRTGTRGIFRTAILIDILLGGELTTSVRLRASLYHNLELLDCCPKLLCRRPLKDDFSKSDFDFPLVSKL